MRVPVDSGHSKQLEAVLTAANGGALKNTATVADVLRLAERAELRLDVDGLPKSLRAGAEAAWRGPGPVAKSYGYRMTRTRLVIRRARKGWFLIAAERALVYPRQPEEFVITISAKQRDLIVKRTLDPYEVLEGEVDGLHVSAA